MLRRHASLLALTIVASAPLPPLRVDLGRLIDPAEVECLMRPPQDGVRWTWNGSYCVGLVVGRLEE